MTSAAVMDTPTPQALAAIWEAIEAAGCPHREGPYGLYDYSNYPGTEPPHVVRDFRDPRSADWGKAVFRTSDAAAAKTEFTRLTHEHIAMAAYRASMEAAAQ
jgi:hypothetical protein